MISDQERRQLLLRKKELLMKRREALMQADSDTESSFAEPIEKSKGLKGVGQDIAQGIKDAPGALIDMISQLPGEAFGAYQTATKDPRRLGQNVLGGLAQGGSDILNLPGNVRDYLAEKELISEDSPSMRLPEKIGPLRFPKEFNYPEALGREGEKPGDALVQSLMSSAPFILGGEIGLAGKTGLKGAARKLGQRSGSQAAFAAGENENPTTAALMAMAMEGGHGALSQAMKNIKKLAPSNMLRGELTPEELASNAKAAGDTETNLGRVIGSPSLSKAFENTLSRIPFSGAEKSMQRTASKIIKQGQDTLENMLGDVEPKKIPRILQDALKDTTKAVEKEKQEYFNKVNKAADEAGVVAGRTNLSSQAQKIIQEIESSPELMHRMPKEFINDIYEMAVNDAGNTIEKSDIFRGHLGDKASEYYKSGNKFAYGKYRALRDALSKDIDTAIDTSGVEDLKRLHKQARDFYKENVVPLEDPDITKFTRKGGDPDLLMSHFLRTGKTTDRSGLLSKLLDHIPDKDRQLVPYTYYSRAIKEGKFDPNAFRTLHKNLGKSQKEALFNNKQVEKSMDDYARLIGLNSESLNAMFNPKTGQRLTDNLLLGALITSIGKGYSAGGIPGAVVGGIAGTTLPGLITKPLVNKLTSPKYREKLIKKMIDKDTPAAEKTKIENAMEVFSNALSATSKAATPLEIQLNKYARKESDKDKK